MNNLLEEFKTLIFKVIFHCGKLVESFQFFSFKNIGLGDQLLLIVFFLKILIFEVLYFLKMCPIFVGSVHNFGRSDGDKV